MTVGRPELVAVVTEYSIGKCSAFKSGKLAESKSNASIVPVVSAPPMYTVIGAGSAGKERVGKI